MHRMSTAGNNSSRSNAVTVENSNRTEPILNSVHNHNVPNVPIVVTVSSSESTTKTTGTASRSPLAHVVQLNSHSAMANGIAGSSGTGSGPGPDPHSTVSESRSSASVKRLAVPSLLSSVPSSNATSRQASASNANRSLSRTKMVLGIFITTGICLSYVGASQFSKSTLTSDTGFSAPVFLVWFNTSWMVVVFPLFLFGSMLNVCCKRQSPDHKTVKGLLKHSSQVFGAHGITLRSILSRCLPFTLLWFVSNASYVYALKFISVTETTALFASNIAFVYLLSWICLHEKFVALRVLGILFAITGIILTAHGEGISNMNFVGVILAVTASACSALYKVLFKRTIGDATLGQVSLFLSFLGLANVFLCWSFALLLLLTAAETVDWNNAPWHLICGSAMLALCYNFLINLGVAYTYPLLISVGIFLGTPLNSVIDVVFRSESLAKLQVIGAVSILASFCLLLAPENFCDSCLRVLGCRGPTEYDRHPHQRRPKSQSHRRSKITDYSTT